MGQDRSRNSSSFPRPQSEAVTEEVRGFYLRHTLALLDFHEETYVRFGNRDYLWYPDFSQNHLGKREAHPEGCS